MTKIIQRVTARAKGVSQKSIAVLQHEGVLEFAKQSSRYLYHRKFPDRKPTVYKDILFINGCGLPHPARYRVDHQVEQLQSAGMSADQVFYEQLDLDMLRYYRGFVFFRCPVTDTVREFIAEAKFFNKACFFDVDDLVIDTKYSDTIKYVAQMSVSEKALYDDGVKRMGETLQLCDYAITTTERLQTELQHYTKQVYIHRNVASDEMIGTSNKALKTLKRDTEKVVIGYFSGSITHNEDFEMVLPSLVALLEKHQNVYLKIAGYLDIPSALKPFTNRILTASFMDWRQMPQEVAQCDINIAPLTKSIFNEAKSENKWTEAALVKVPTVASNIGAFKTVIHDGVDGLLVNDSDWFKVLDDLITDRAKREEIGTQAYKAALAGHTTVGESRKLADIFQANLARNIAFYLPSTDISGGVNVVLKHAEIMRGKGWDVTLVDTIDKRTFTKSRKKYSYRLTVPGYNVVTLHQIKIEAFFDTAVATLWSTLAYVKECVNVRNRLYFVQSFETDFYPHGSGKARFNSNSTYSDMTGVRYVTMSRWCQRWLKDKFGKEARYASNGIDLDLYPTKTRTFNGPKTKILIEGDSKDEYKNTDEAFRVVEKLDPKKYEISYLSYRKSPKSWYRVDHFHSRVAPEKVGEIYASCDILIKTSLLESFSYPPLEMMATGGYAVVVPNEGNQAYLRDGENCLFYKQGNLNDAVAKINLIETDSTLRKRLRDGGLKTAQDYQWKNLTGPIADLYK